MTAKRVDGEWRITIAQHHIANRYPDKGFEWWAGKHEAMAYYTDDAEDALETAMAMSKSWEEEAATSKETRATIALTSEELSDLADALDNFIQDKNDYLANEEGQAEAVARLEKLQTRVLGALNTGEQTADKQAQAMIVEVGKIRRAEHSGYPGLSDKVENTDDYLWRVARANPSEAAAVAARWKLEPEKYSAVSGLSPERVGQLGGQLAKEAAGDALAAAIFGSNEERAEARTTVAAGVTFGAGGAKAKTATQVKPAARGHGADQGL